MVKAATNVDVNADSGDWESVVVPFADTWDFDKHPELIGTYKGRRETEQDVIDKPGETRIANIYEIEEGTTGETYSVWGTWAIDSAFLGELQKDDTRKLTGKEIQVGNQVRFVYEGKADQDGGRTVRKFTIQTRSV